MKKIYLLHGWTYSFDKWTALLKILSKNNIYCEMLEIPGLTAELKEIWTIDDYATWLKEKIGNEKVILLGHSNGGRIALYFSSLYPKSVEKLILIDSAGIYHRDFFLTMKRNVFKTIAQTGKKITASPLMKKLLYRIAGEQDYNLSSPTLKKTMLNLIAVDLTPLLSKITMPTLLIWGEKDQITKLSDGQLMQQKIKDAKLRIVKNGRHSPFSTHPKETSKLIIDFVRQSS